MPHLRAWIGAILRTLADRIDPAGAVIRTGLSFTFEDVAGGMFLRSDGRGCPLYRIGTADLRLAHEDADSLHPVHDDWDVSVTETVRLKVDDAASA